MIRETAVAVMIIEYKSKWDVTWGNIAASTELMSPKENWEM